MVAAIMMMPSRDGWLRNYRFYRIGAARARPKNGVAAA
jgi:hypothetical protein